MRLLLRPLLVIIFSFVILENGPAQTGDLGKVLQDTQGREWSPSTEGLWKEKYNKWERTWKVQRVHLGYILLMDPRRGILMALPLSGGRAYMTHLSHGIWFPYPLEIKNLEKMLP